MTPALENRLVERFSFLFAHNDDWVLRGVTEHYPIACGDGWFTLIERTCESLAGLKRKFERLGCVDPWLPRASIFSDDTTGQEGMMRFDLSSSSLANGTPLTAEIRRGHLAEGMAWLASNMSLCVCEVCGKPGLLAGKRVRCAAHRYTSIYDAEQAAAHDVARLIAAALNPEAKVVAYKTPTKKRPPRV